MIHIFYVLLLLAMTELSSSLYLEPSPQFNPKMEVAAVYIENGDKILLLHRQDNKSQGNKWGNPGGKVNKSETPLQAAVREVKEETGLEFSECSIEPLRTVYVEYSETNHFIHHIFRAKFNGNPNDIKINTCEHKGFAWVTPGDALKMDLLKDEDASIKLIYFR